MEQLPCLLGMTLQQLKEVVAALGLPAFTAKQLAEWIYGKRVSDFDAMTNLSKTARQRLAETWRVGMEAPVDAVRSADGTVKYLFRAGDSHYIESVYIPEGDRATLCISSQIGCKMNCRFCATGRQGFSGQLSVAEILNQVQCIDQPDSLTNVVFMGMGEPMDNLDNVLQAIEIMTASYGYGWSPKRITVSSVGLIPGIRRFLDSCSCHLAISLHAPNDTVRATLIPAQKAYPAGELLDVLRQYDFSHQRRLSFEYTMFQGVNDTPADARELARNLQGLDCHINLIPFHAVDGTGLRPTPPAEMERFMDLLNRLHFPTTIRRSRGQDIEAACGLLSTKRMELNA